MLLRALGILTLFATAASAQQMPCAPTDAMIAHVESRYGEGAAFEGLVNETARMVLFVNAGSRTWTVLLAKSDGTSCILLSGSEADVVPLRVPGNPT